VIDAFAAEVINIFCSESMKNKLETQSSITTIKSILINTTILKYLNWLDDLEQMYKYKSMITRLELKSINT
jgi:hypothetical protein